MTYIHRNDNILFAEDVSLQTIAEEIGTPSYVYSRKAIEEAYHAFYDPLKLSNQAFQLHYAVKANSTLAVLNILAKLGAGFDIVSGGELARVLKAGGKPENIVFSGVGKSMPELQFALEAGVGVINVESASEMTRLNNIAKQLNKTVKIMLRINPDIKTDNHPYIATGHKENKFGISILEAKNLIRLQSEQKHFSHIQIIGLATHIGSQILDMAPFLAAVDKIFELREYLAGLGITLNEMNLGGGLGVRYREESPPSPKEYIEVLLKHLQPYANASPFNLHLEPGRAIIANAGILLTRVEYLKHQFAIVDAGMNDLIRPSLYNAEHSMYPVILTDGPDTPAHIYDVVGPVCETGDFLAKNRMLSLEENSYLAIFGAGAYGFSMSSNYNTRPRAAEVMVDGDYYQVIRPRETVESLFATETILKNDKTNPLEEPTDIYYK